MQLCIHKCRDAKRSHLVWQPQFSKVQLRCDFVSPNAQMLNFGTQPDFASCCWVKVGNENVIYFLGVVRFPWFVGFFNVAKFIKSLCFFRLRLFLWDLVGQLPLFDYFVQPMYSLLPMRYMLQSHFLHPTCLIVKFP